MTPSLARHGRLASLATLAALLWSAPAGVAARANASEKVYATVVDGQRHPVTGLSADDFSVELDGQAQEVVSAVPAADAMSLVILTDRLGPTSTYTAFDVRQALTEFVTTIRKTSPDSKIALTTFDGTTMEVTKFTAAPAQLDRALARLGTTATDAVLLDALNDVCKMFVRQAPTDRRLIFTLLAAYRPDQSSLRNEVAVEILRLSKASLWTVEVREASRGNFSNNVREVVLDTGGQMSGGFRDIVASRSGVHSSTKHVAELMLAQYAITYAPGGGSAGSRLRIGVRRPGLSVLAPRWTSR
jgi:hypothetical protein